MIPNTRSRTEAITWALDAAVEFVGIQTVWFRQGFGYFFHPGDYCKEHNLIGDVRIGFASLDSNGLLYFCRLPH